MCDFSAEWPFPVSLANVMDLVIQSPAVGGQQQTRKGHIVY